jgi:translation initiation factor 2B subunit (eIF-2B alpha/beta/delta family)
MNRELYKIINDNKSGSLQILNNLIKFCRKNLSDRNELSNVCELSRKKLFQFAVIENFIVLFEKKISKSNSEELETFLLDYEMKLKNISDVIYLENKAILNKLKSFTTISFSKTLLDIIKIRIKEKNNLKVFVLESRPMLEGRKFALELSKLNVNVTLVVDAFMCYAVKNSNAILIGADQILKNGNVVNKIGSYPLALCAKELKKTFYVIADKSKFVNKSKYIPNSFQGSEVYSTKKNITIVNQYFEEIPSKFITKILTN